MLLLLLWLLSLLSLRLLAPLDADSEPLAAQHVLVEALYGSHRVVALLEHDEPIAGRLTSDWIDGQAALQYGTVGQEEVAQLHVAAQCQVVHVEVATVGGVVWWGRRG